MNIDLLECDDGGPKIHIDILHDQYEYMPESTNAPIFV